MKRSLILLAALLALAVALAGAEPIGLTVGTKVATGDILGGVLPVTVKPYVDYAVGETGFYVGASWEIPVVPFSLGLIDAYQEYDVSAAGFDFALGNYNSFDIPGSGFYGCVYGTAAYGLPFGFTPKVEVDFNYYAFWSLDAYVFLNFKTDLGPGQLGAEARLYMPAYPSFSLDSLRGKLNYTLPVGPFNVKGELVPTLAFPSMAVKLAVAVYASMDL